MNEAHVHLAVNHFPIIGTIFGIGILIAGMVYKNNSIKNTAYFMFTIAAIFAAISMNTGEGAEEIVENMPDIGKQIIHEHEEIAEKFAILMYALGFFSLLSMFLTYKKHKFSSLASYVALIVAIVSGVLAKGVGTSGGEIRHTEIRANTPAVNSTENNQQNILIDNKEDDKD